MRTSPNATAVDAAVLEFVDPDGSGPQPAALAERLLVGPDLAGLLDQVYADENVSTGAVTWLLADNLDSTRDAIDANGNVLGHYVFNSFGQLVSGPTSVTQFLFTGRWTDTNTGLQYNGNRWYDPAVGRWISEDPADLTYDANASRYVGNQPTTFIDPTGLSGESGSAPLVWPYSAALPALGPAVSVARGAGGNALVLSPARPHGVAAPFQAVAFRDPAVNDDENEQQLKPGDPDYLKNGVFLQNRKIGGHEARDRYNLFTHTFVVVTGPNGDVKRTYSWGNRLDDNHAHWFKNRKEDMDAARAGLKQYHDYYTTKKTKRWRLPDNWGKRVPGVSPWQVEPAYRALRRPGSPSDHINFWGVDNCKTEANRLIKDAKKQGQIDNAP